MGTTPMLGRATGPTAETRLRLLVDAGALLSAALTVDDGLERLAELLVSELGDYAVTYLLDGDRVRRVGVGHRDTVADDAVRGLLTLPTPTLETAGAGQVMATGEPVLARGITPRLLAQAAQNPAHLRILRSLDPTSSIIVPLRASRETFGAIALATVAGGAPEFTPADLEFMMELANRVALVADNARLYAESQAELGRRRAAESELRERYGQLQVLYRMAESVSRAGAAEEVYERALSALTASLRADRASILLYDDDGVLRFKAWQGLSAGYRTAVEGHSPWTRETVDPDPIVVPDVAADPDLDEPLRGTILGEGIAALAFFPLPSRDGLLGKFMVYFDRPHRMSGTDVELARAVAQSVSFAITRVRGEHRLRAALDAAKEASQVKSQFLAVMSHELRTPLNAVMGYSDLLAARTDGPLTDRQETQVDRIRVSAQLLVELIDEVLIYARLEAGKEEVRSADVDLGPLIRETCAIVEPHARGKGLELRIDDPDDGPTIRTDPGKVRQIVLNLLSNAVKFTDTGHVDIAIERHDDAASIHVRDTGPGIDHFDRERIFEPFTQGDSSATRRKGGTGLGLAVSRRLAAVLGGELELESEAGKGSRFTLRLPAK